MSRFIRFITFLGKRKLWTKFVPQSHGWETKGKSHNLWRLHPDLSNQLNALLLNIF